MHRDLLPCVPTGVRKGEHIVVTLHGLFATAGAMRPARQVIEQRTSARTASFTWEPGCDVSTLAHRLDALLSRLPRTAHIHLVGHSLGGVVARYYVQLHARDDRVRQTISLGSPFAGTTVALWVPRFLSRDALPDSPVLRRLALTAHVAAHIPHTSIAATHDQWVKPWTSALLPHGQQHVMRACGHNALLFDSDSLRVVSDAIQSLVTPTQRESTGAQLSG